MLRNRSKISQRRNVRNARSRNHENYDQSSELSSSSDYDSSQYDSSNSILFDDSSDSSSFEEECKSPVLGRKLKTRRKRMNSKSKCSNKENDNRNRNSRSSNVTNNRKSHRRSDSNTAGPSRINNSRRSRSENSNNRTAKRKYKDRKDESRTSDSGPCNTSSEDIDDVLFPMKKKRVRRVLSNSSESDESVIQSTRRRSILDSESSSAASEIIFAGRRRNQNRSSFPSWSDSTSDRLEENSLRESSSSPASALLRESTGEGSGSPIIGVSSRRDLMTYINSSDSSASTFSIYSGVRTTTTSTDSDSMNAVSVPDSEASSYNTAQSSNNNNKDQISDSDSSDSDGEKCAICLKKFRTQLIGNPSNCEHNFCAPCLKKWSENSTTCPVDRSTFDSIVIRSEINGQIVDRVKVENRNFGIFPPLNIDEVLLNDSINCEICGSGEDEETLLLCDFCNLGFHMACLSPPLSAIPAGSWYCPPCTSLHSDPTQNMNEAMRIFSDFPGGSLILLPQSRRTNRIRTRTARSRPGGSLPRGRGPTTRGVRSHDSLQREVYPDLSNMIESFVARFNAITPAESTRRKKRRRNRARNNANLGLQVTAAGSAEATVDGKDRIIRKVNKRISTPVNTRPITRPSGPSEIVDMVFPSFSLFGSDELDYFSDEQGELDVDGEVAIMARVRSEYSARRMQNHKRIASSLLNNYDRVNPTMEETGASSSAANLLDSILESQTLWHSKNVEIKSKKDGSLEVKLRNEEKKPDLTNTTHSSKEIPLFPNKGDGSSENKSYTNNSRYSSLGSGSGGGGNSFSQSTSSMNSLNPSTRPGFSNLLGNNSPALDLSPFRGAAPIRFRMNPPRPAMRRQNYNANSQRQSSNSSSLMNSVQSPKKAVSNADDDVDLYDDIDTENADNEKSQEIFASLEPPPEPPALLIGSDSSSDDENNGLVIDDKAINKSNIYDPTEPNEDSDNESNQDKNSNMVPGYLRSPSYGGLSEFGPHLPLPEPPALPMELDSVKDSDEEEEAECPNMTLYSSTSMNLANNVQDIPIPDAAYPQDDLDCIPIPTASPGDARLSESETKEVEADSRLYSPTDKHDSESSSLGDIEEVSVKGRSPSSPSKIRNDVSDIRSISSRDSSKERVSSARSSSVESNKSEHYGRKSRKTRRGSKDKRSDDKSDKEESEIIDLDRTRNEKPAKEIDLTEVDSNDEKEGKIRDSVKPVDDDAKPDEMDDKDDTESVTTVEEIKDKEKSDDESDKDADEQSVPAAGAKSDDGDKTDTDEDKREAEKESVASVEKDKSDKEDSIADAEATADAIPDNDSAKANSVDVNTSGNYLLPSEDLDPVSDVEYNDFPDYQRSSSVRDRRKKRKKTRRRDSSTDKNESKELEEGEIEEEKSKRKYAAQKKKARSETPERSPDRKQRRRRDRREKNTGKENKESELQWKKLSKNTKERNYRDGKKPNEKSSDRNKEREMKSKKEKRKEIERYDVRKIVSDKPRPMRDEFGRDISMNRSRSRTRSRSLSYRGRRESKSSVRRSLSQDDRWIDWSPVWNQRRSRSRTRRSHSRSRNRSRLSGDRYINRSKNREYDKRESRKRRRSISSEIDKYSPPPAELKKRRRSRDRSRKSESYAPIRSAARDLPEYYYDRSWSRTISYASLTPEAEPYVRYSRSPSINEPPARIPIVTPDHEHSLMTPNPQNLTVIVPNVDIVKKKHKKKKETKKKKKKQPSKEVFTSGDNIVVSVNFDDNQKIISAKSSKRKHDEEKVRKKKKDETRKKRKQTLQVSEEVLNAKPVAVIDLNTSPCKEMSPTEVISLTDSGDEANANEKSIPADRRISENQDANKSPERRAYVMTQSGPKTPPEPPIKFTVNSTAPMRPLPTNPIFEQDEIDHEEDSVHYNKGPNTPPEPSNQQCRSMSPNATMYDPFEPTKSRSQSPSNAQIYEERKEVATSEERRPVIDMFSEDNDKPNESQNAEKSKPQEDAKENTTPKTTPAEEPQNNASFTKTSPAKEPTSTDSTTETNQTNGGNTLVLDLSSLGDDFVPKSTIPLVKTSQGKYEFQSGKAPDKPITVVISQQSQPAKPQPQQVMVTPTRQVPTKPVEPMKQSNFPDLMTWKLPPPISQANFSTPPPAITSSLPPGTLVTPSKSAPGLLTQNGSQEESSFEIDDSPYSPASSEGDELFEPPPLNASTSSPNKQRPSPMPAVNSYKSRVDALFTSSPIKKMPPRSNVPPVSKPVSAIKGTKKIMKPPMSSKKEVGIKADEEQLKILDDVPNSAVEMIVKEKFLKKLHRQERVVEEVKVVLKPHYAKKHITKEDYKDILRKAVPKICHNKSGDINPSKIQGLVEAYVKKARYSKKKPTMGAGAPLFPSVKTTGKPMKQQKSLWG